MRSTDWRCYGLRAFVWPRSSGNEASSDEDMRFKCKEEIALKLDGLTKKLRAKFEAEYGSICCDDIETKIFGRSFDK
jgi:hypothetical protein